MKSIILLLSILLCSSVYAQKNSKKNKQSENVENSIKGRIDKLIALGDNSFNSRDYQLAKRYYTDALALDSTLVYPKDKIAQIESTVREEELQYTKLIAAADAKFAVKDYVKAKEYYLRATQFKPSDPYPKQKLAEIDAILNPPKID